MTEETEVMTAEVERVEVEPASAEVMACDHAISTKRVELWWEAETRRQRPRDVGMCGCCTGPCPSGTELCRFCARETVQPRLPYGEAAR